MKSKQLRDILTNFEILDGSYFAGVFVDGPLYIFRSTTFPDIGWNYAILDTDGRTLSEPERSIISDNINTDTPIHVISAEQLENIKKREQNYSIDIDEYSVWMSCEELAPPQPANHVIKSHLPKEQSIITEAVDCFRAAYCGPSEGRIGYSELGNEYPAGFKKMLEEADRAHLLTSSVGEKIVGVASVVFHAKKPVAGLYNVAVHPDFQRRGIGASLSWEASKYALSNGAHRCILQTEADSEVAQMYEKIGYSTDILTYFYELNS